MVCSFVKESSQSDIIEQHKALPVRTHFIEPQRQTSIHTQNGYIAEHTNVRETGVWRMSEIA